MAKDPLDIFRSVPAPWAERTVWPDGFVSNESGTDDRDHHVLKKPANTSNPPDAYGWRKPSAYSGEFVSFSRRLSGVSVRNELWGGAWFKTTRNGVHPATYNRVPRFAASTSLIARAELQALLAMRDLGGDLNLAVSFGERREAAKMFQDNLLRVGRAYRAFRKGDLKGVKRHLSLDWRRTPDRWLEYQYGWKPLLSDVHSAVKAINDKDRSDPQRLATVVRGTAKAEQSWTSDQPTGNFGFDIRTAARGKAEVRVRLDILPDEDEQLLRPLNDLGILNPLNVAWELLPFSFVVDWAVPIGDYLSAMTASYGVKLKGGSRTVFERTTGRLSAVPINSATRTWDYCALRGFSSDTVWNRTVYSAFPFPSYQALNPLVGADAKDTTIATRVANTLSILATMVRK